MIRIGGTNLVGVTSMFFLNGYTRKLAEINKGSLVISPPLLEAALANPFDSPGDSPLSSCPSSDEELYSHAADLPIPITPEPVMRRNVNTSGPAK